MSRALLLVGVLSLVGCDTLFPEFGGSKPVDASVTDAGSGDGGTDGSLRLAGVVCILTDLRDYRSCALGSPGLLRITVEETRQTAMTDAAGHFTLPLSQMLQTAVVAVIDPAGNFTPTIVPVRLTGGIAANLALPVASAQTLGAIALQNGITLDGQHGSLLGWAIDPTGAPVAGVASNQSAALYDDTGGSQLTAGTATHAHGAIALLNIAPTQVSLGLNPPASAAVGADSFTVPIRAGALTATTLVLPPR